VCARQPCTYSPPPSFEHTERAIPNSAPGILALEHIQQSSTFCNATSNTHEGHMPGQITSAAPCIGLAGRGGAPHVSESNHLSLHPTHPETKSSSDTYQQCCSRTHSHKSPPEHGWWHERSRTANTCRAAGPPPLQPPPHACTAFQKAHHPSCPDALVGGYVRCVRQQPPTRGSRSGIAAR